MKNIFTQVTLVNRHVEKRDLGGKATCATILEAVYDTEITELWNALTNKTRLPIWFAPVEGDFKQSGRFQIKGNAEGEIIQCKSEKSFELTWEFGGDVSWVKLGIVSDNDKTRLTLEHLAHSESEHFETYGPGATGVGWDFALVGLEYYLRTNQSIQETDFMTSPAVKKIVSYCAKDWCEATIKAGFDKEKSTLAATNTETFYLGEE
jgi:uncharacterized protein YndB with AHSA1/START domain